jgi:DNA-binding MarR family transcriptional regulator
MVKTLDDTHLVDDHIGLDLWRAAVSWRDRLNAEMVGRGHAFYGDARSAVAAHLNPSGMPQAELVRRMGMTKQAVQQLLDGLESDGIIVREPDPSDGRGKRIVYTQRGRAALKDAAKVKREIERDYRARLGGAALETLKRSLRKLALPAGDS